MRPSRALLGSVGACRWRDAGTRPSSSVVVARLPVAVYVVVTFPSASVVVRPSGLLESRSSTRHLFAT
jgi:hypothetical protein